MYAENRLKHLRIRPLLTTIVLERMKIISHLENSLVLLCHLSCKLESLTRQFVTKPFEALFYVFFFSQ